MNVDYEAKLGIEGGWVLIEPSIKWLNGVVSLAVADRLVLLCGATAVKPDFAGANIRVLVQNQFKTVGLCW